MSTSYTPTAEAIAFFVKHAASSHAPQGCATLNEGADRTARDYAEAEALYLHAHQVADVVCEWEPDGDSMAMARRDGWLRRGEFLYAALITHTDSEGVARCVASLHGIDDDSDAYRRVVRAELAQEAADELRAIIAAASQA